MIRGFIMGLLLTLVEWGFAGYEGVSLFEQEGCGFYSMEVEGGEQNRSFRGFMLVQVHEGLFFVVCVRGGGRRSN
jgi:hypothetical protein